MTSSSQIRRRLDDARNQDAKIYAAREDAIKKLMRLDAKLRSNRQSMARLSKSLRLKVREERVSEKGAPPLPADSVDLRA